MKRSAFFMVGAAGLLLAGRAPDAAAEPRQQPVRITWVRPERLSPAQRTALARVLVEAAEGRALRGVLVKDSHPRVDCHLNRACRHVYSAPCPGKQS